MKKIDCARDPIGYALYVESFVRRAAQRMQRNNSIGRPNFSTTRRRNGGMTGAAARNRS